MLEYFQNIINRLKKEDRYREFIDVSRIAGRFPYAINNKTGKEIIIWCSNDYLGMGQNQNSINQACQVMQEYGIGSGGTRNISGNNHKIVELEKEVALLHKKEAGLTFTSGYVANDATIQALAKIIPNLVIFSDENNHASIISGVRNSRLEKNIFKHNDMSDLENLLKKYDVQTPKLIIFESVYSMDGDFGKIEEIANLAKKYGALTLIDEVHGVGLYGQNGAGVCEEFGLENKIDLIQGTFAKSFGAIGGYVTGKQEIIDAIRLTASGFIFTTSLPPAISAGIISNIKHLKNSNFERQKMRQNVALLKEKLSKIGVDFVENDSHIISVRIGNAAKAMAISSKLMAEYGIYVQHINYPTVAKGDERLRITVTPLHDEKMMNDLVAALVRVI